MELIAFELSGRTGFFKKPDVNANTYFTYSHIHKVALLGLLGAVLGFAGHQCQHQDIQQNGHNEGNRYPQFYAKLMDVKIAIVPHGDRGYFSKKIQYFNNTVGYASQEAGGNLIIKEQWLENPKWTIYVLNDENVPGQLKDYLLNGTSIFIPYLGKNDHPANLLNARTVNSETVVTSDRIDSLFYSEGVHFKKRGTTGGNAYYFEEWMPVGLNQGLNDYEFAKISFTNRLITTTPETMQLVESEGKVLSFI